jgi:hypothetical protein
MFHPGWTCNNTALAGATGWWPRIRLDEGLRRTLGGPAGGSASERVLAQC